MAVVSRLGEASSAPTLVPVWSASDSPRDRILAAACELFNRSGIRSVGVDAIMAAAGVARGTFYRYFPGKDDLVLAFLERSDTEWRSWFTAAVHASGGDARARMIGVFQMLPGWFASASFRGSPVLNVAAELGGSQPGVTELAGAHTAWVRAFLVALAVQAGTGQPEELACRLQLLLNGAVVTAQLESAVAARHQVAGHAVAAARAVLAEALPG